MELDIVEIVREAFKDKELILEELPGNKVKIWYKSYNVTNLKPVILPKNIKMDKEFLESVGLYMADGKTTPNDMRHIEFASIDPDIAKFMLNFFIHRMNVAIEDIYIRIRHSNCNEDELKKKWSEFLNMPKEKVIIKKYGKNKTDCCEIHINSKVLRVIYEKMMRISLKEVREHVELSRAFLRGHFAADGGVEIRKNKHLPQIQYLIFAYHKTKEAWLRDYIINLLKLNGIYKIKIKESKKCETACIRMACWENAGKIWNMKLFDRSIRKKNIFMASLRNSFIYLRLDATFRSKLFSCLKMTQKEIGNLINCSSDGQICDTIHGKHLLRLEQINKIIEQTNFDWKDVINNSTELRMGQRGYFAPETNLINFLLNEKGLV